MKWFVFLFVALGAAAYLGYIEVPLPADFFGKADKSVKTDAAALPVSSLLKLRLHTEAIRTAARNVLLPLESRQTALDNLRAQVTAPGGLQDGAREAQALVLLSQALAERTAILARLQPGSSGHDPLDYVPGNWHVAGHPEKPVDPTAQNEKWRSTFWAQTEIKKWNERREYYRAQIQALLTPQSP
jgi:hypothetical protein